MRALLGRLFRFITAPFHCEIAEPQGAVAAEPDPRGLFILFEPEPTLALLPIWWIEIDTIRALGRSYRGIEIEDLIHFDWLTDRDGSVLGLSFMPPTRCSNPSDCRLQRALEPLNYVDDAGKMPTIWFSAKRDSAVSPGSCIRQDFAAALYLAQPGSWALSVNINWLPIPQRERLKQLPCKFVEADCELTVPGKGTSLCKGFTTSGLYALRNWFASSEGH